jgi:acetate kinase
MLISGMGLTPLEGLIGGTRSGTIDPTAIFHMLKDPGADAGLEGMSVTNSEMVLNKWVIEVSNERHAADFCRKSGLQALAGTTNFGTILSRISGSSSDPEEDCKKAKLAYAVYLDRLLSYISQYLFKLLSSTPLEEIDGIVFSGGIGEKGAELRRDVLQKFQWLGAEIDQQGNETSKGEVRAITTEQSKLKGWVVETDEEKQCATLARQQLDF